jgi:predicted polyphosphate/ATP-dependent NAD kinase
LASDARFRLGLIVNPVAGMGGPVGLKGTDGKEVLAQAVARGAHPRSAGRAAQALAELEPLRDRLIVMTASGGMGADIARAAGFETVIVHRCGADTQPGDTKAAARGMTGANVILFCGGDGTARDLEAAVGERMPVIGVPAGVKMQSGVFATSPRAAGRLARALIERGGGIRTRLAEVMDIDEEAYRHNRLSARLYGYLAVPAEPGVLQSPKRSGYTGDEAGVSAAAAAVARELEPGVAYVVGPGRSAKAVLAALGLDGSLLGVDLVIDGALAGRDLTQDELIAATAGRPLRIIAGITGGQGFLFGRGNQQIAPGVIRRAGRDGLIVIAGRDKLAAIAGGRLLAETGDAALDTALAGYLRVRCSATEWLLMEVAAA